MRNEFYETLTTLLDPELTDDTEFAEFFVMMDKLGYMNKPKWTNNLTREDMGNFNEKMFCHNLEKILWEVIHSDEIMQSAWWKQEGSD